jgi:hypothetical protein
MQMGDVVTVRITGRRARIIEDLGNSHYRVLLFEDPDVDALDRETRMNAGASTPRTLSARPDSARPPALAGDAQQRGWECGKSSPWR